MMQHMDIAFIVFSFAGVFAAAYALSRLQQALLRLSCSFSQES